MNIRSAAGEFMEHCNCRVVKATMIAVTSFVMVAVGLLATAPAATPPHAKVTELMTKEMKDFPGKEGHMILVEYPPGAEDPVHRHNAHAFVYVLEGSIVMQVKGGPEVTLNPGQTYYEAPDDVHVIGRNASKTKPAKFTVLLVKDKGAPVLVPEK